MKHLPKQASERMTYAERMIHNAPKPLQEYYGIMFFNACKKVYQLEQSRKVTRTFDSQNS